MMRLSQSGPIAREDAQKITAGAQATIKNSRQFSYRATDRSRIAAGLQGSFAAACAHLATLGALVWLACRPGWRPDGFFLAIFL